LKKMMRSRTPVSEAEEGGATEYPATRKASQDKHGSAVAKASDFAKATTDKMADR